MTNPQPETAYTSRMWVRTTAIFAIRTALVLSIVLAIACEKPKPPAPPAPPPPPPPPPPPLVLADVAKERRADPRVQFADQLTVGADELSLANAVVGLADALAKGDAKAMRSLLLPPSQDVLNELEQSGDWEKAVSGLEAVRVVLVRSGVSIDAEAAGKDGAPGAAGASVAEVRQKIEAAAAGLPEKTRGIISGALAAIPAETAASAFQAGIASAVEKVKAAGASEADVSRLNELAAALSGGGEPTGGGSGTVVGVLTAIQDPDGAYLLGWGALKTGDRWLFTAAPATDDVRARAAAFDGMGPEAFGLGGDSKAAGTEKTPRTGGSGPGDGPDKPNAAAPAEPTGKDDATEPDQPSRRVPVRIPGRRKGF